MSVTQKSKGRSSELIDFRNRKLIARFYYYSSIMGLKFSVCLTNLILEFDISSARICDIISQNADKVQLLERNEVGVTELREHFPFMVWQAPLSTPLRRYQKQSASLF